MVPEISIGPLTLQTFGLMFALAFIVGGVLAHKRFQELGKPGDWAYEAVFSALIGGIVGARLYWLLENLDSSDGFFSTLFSGSGLTWYGGAIGGALGVLLWAKWRDYLNLKLADVAAPALAAGYAVGRIGCQLSGDGDYGRPSDLPWAMGYPEGTVPTPPGVTVHPTPIYEILAMIPIVWALWWLAGRNRSGWWTFGWFLILSGVERLLVEFLRRNPEWLVGLTQPQWISIAGIVIGFGLVLAFKGRRAERVNSGRARA
jgi:phosphatidylglycerol:prolipoprotein diacylglycerol transferase